MAVLFMKTKPPIDAVGVVHTICEDAMATQSKRTRTVKRLTPMTLIGKATETGLEDTARKVLAPHFHTEGIEQKKVNMLRLNPTVLQPRTSSHNAVRDQAQHQESYQATKPRLHHQDCGQACRPKAQGRPSRL